MNKIKLRKSPGAEPQPSATAGWEVRCTEEIYDNGFFRLRRDQCALERQAVSTTSLYVLEMPDCVSIVPLTSDGRIILINQYRHAVGRSVLECPGGTIHRHHDDPISAAKRELLEETGYAAGRLVSVGSHDLNPGGQTTRIHTFVAQDCERVAEPMLESFESLTTQLVTREDLADLVRGSGHFQTTTLASLMLGLQHIDNSTRTFGTDGVWA